MKSKVRKFKTGATRDTDLNKPDYEGFLSPLVIQEFGNYMNKNRIQSDGSIRESDNWQKGISSEVYMKSLFRHFMQVWLIYRGNKTIDEKGNKVNLKEALCGVMFNAQGYLHEVVK